MCWTAGVGLVPRVGPETLIHELGGFLILKKKKKTLEKEHSKVSAKK